MKWWTTEEIGGINRGYIDVIPFVNIRYFIPYHKRVEMGIPEDHPVHDMLWIWFRDSSTMLHDDPVLFSTN